MKECCNCHEIKPLTEFNKRKASKDGYQPRCKTCHALHNKQHYQENKDVYKQRAVKFRSELREWFVDIKSQLVCERCGETKHWRLDFHHPDPTVKDGNIAEMIATTMSRKKVLAEIEKCQVLCRNCHADVHYEINNGSLV